MRYVIIRDDDTNAFTPVECLERLYRPFLDRGLPVNLAVIPDVSVDATMGDGRPEGFLLRGNGRLQPGVAAPGMRNEKATRGVGTLSDEFAVGNERTVPFGSNDRLVRYLLENPGFRIAQHGCHHDYHEFDRRNRKEMAMRLEHGTKLLLQAGFARPETFVAPYDKISRGGLKEISRRFKVLSTGWFELRRLPYAWWPGYFLKKFRRLPHWRAGGTLLLSHPGCLLSYHRTYSTMMGGILHYLKTQQLTVLVTHWWEYFRDGHPDDAFIDFLHETAQHLATHRDIKVITFADLVDSVLVAY